MKKIFLIPLLLCSYVALAQSSFCVSTKVDAGFLEVSIKQTGATNFNLGTSDIMINTGGLNYTVAGMVTSTTVIGAPYGVDVFEIAPGSLAVSVLHNAGAIAITNTPTLLVKIPITGSGVPTVTGVQNIFSSTGTAIPPDVAGAECAVVLPTELLTFKGNRKGKESQLQWEATNEKNIVNYIVERSSDGRNFHPIGFNKPKSSNANEKVAYDFVDDQPEIGINYYRLLSKGMGKDEKYSKVISLDFGLGLSGRVFPNPLDGDLTVEMDIESNSGDVEVGVYDVVGKQVLSKKMPNSDRRINFVMPTTDLPPGAYIIKIKVGTTYWERKLTKM